MVTVDDAPASSAEASQTNDRESPPPPTPPHKNYMAHDRSDADHVHAFDQLDSDAPPLPMDEDGSVIHYEVDQEHAHHDESVFGDGEMKRQLMDIESSFLPELNAQAEVTHGPAGADDTYLFGGSPGTSQRANQPAQDDAEFQRVMNNLEEMTKPKKKPKKLEVRSGNTPTKPHARYTHHSNSSSISEPPTPADAYKTPAAGRLDFGEEDSMDAEISTSDVAPSSPSAEAAQRSQSRVSAKDTIEEEPEDDAPQEEQAARGAEQNEVDVRRPTSSASTVKAPDFSQLEEGSSLTTDNELSMESTGMPPPSVNSASHRINKRPSYLQHRGSSQRSSVSSFTNRSDVSGDGASTASLGADYSLQTGGAIPRSSGPQRMSLGLSRLPSLGSIASSMSGYSDVNPWENKRSISTNSLTAFLQPDGTLGRLEEEVPYSATPPETPRAPSVQAAAPTDTVITRHVQDIQVPDSIARDFRAKHSRSPDKRNMATPFTRSKHNLTLKEQNSKIDKLSKENFDLKLKIHFLDQALQNRSDEGVKEMISKNVQLQTDLATEKKDGQSMRKKIRDLERRLKAQEEGSATAKDLGSGSEDERSDQSSKQAEMEEEIEFLRERLESTEIVVEQWQADALQKEADNRRMADYIKTMREKSPSGDASLDEAINMWKEDFEDERARREQVETRCQQAEADSERLREEIRRMGDQMQQMQQHSTANQHINKAFNSSRRVQQSFATRSNAGSDGNENTAPGSTGGSGTLVEHLQSDNDKLQRDLHAQASMLTSRNRENLRLREENEGLKLTIRRGDAGSTAGDSILERSISRNHMRSVSRASGATRLTQMSDPEREDMESKHAALRDELSQLKLSYKELDDQLNGHLDVLETTELKVKELEKEIEASNEDLQALANERDEALELLQDKEQECEELRQEALDTVQRLEIDLEQRQTERDRLYNDLENTTEDFNALQQEMKNVSESLLQLEDDRDASLRKIQNLEAELADANQELGRQDKLLSDERSKNERLDVQLESCQGEIDFLREEQEGDKIKIGDLESALNHTQVTLQEARERSRDLEERVAEERQQRDALESQEKQGVEKILTDLNAQLTKLKEDSRKLRKNLSSKEVEASTWKQRHDELEHTLRESLGNHNGTRSSLFKVSYMLPFAHESMLTMISRTLPSFSEISRRLHRSSTLLKLISRRRIDFYVTETHSWRTVVWRAVVSQNCSSANVRPAGKTSLRSKTPSVVTFLLPGRFSNMSREFPSWRRFVVRIVKDSTVWKSNTKSSCLSVTTCFMLCGTVFPPYVVQSGAATMLSSMESLPRWS
jgi:chromosome segregation ATPase